MKTPDRPRLAELLGDELERLGRVARDRRPGLEVEEVGVVTAVGSGIATVRGLPRVRADEVVRFAGGEEGLALDLRRDDVGVVLLGPTPASGPAPRSRAPGGCSTCPSVTRCSAASSIPLGRPLDGDGPVRASRRWPVERPAAPIFAREAVRKPLQTGLKVVDALFPIGRGQRELIVGDRQTGKTTVALSAVLAQADSDVRCVICTIGQRGSATARWLTDLRERGALDYTTVVVAASHESPGLRYVAPYAATSIAESWMEDGHDVLIVYDDLTQHARAYRELSLLLRRPPGREAFPGDIFYLHARLLERATQLKDGGSLTALPVIETQAQDLSAYIPTNLISITDGQLYLSPGLAARGVLPASTWGARCRAWAARRRAPATAPWRATCGSRTRSSRSSRASRASAPSSTPRPRRCCSAAGACGRPSPRGRSRRSPWATRSSRCGPPSAAPSTWCRSGACGRRSSTCGAARARSSASCWSGSTPARPCATRTRSVLGELAADVADELEGERDGDA
jgi:F-type H+/Na+-transporting ATPase subunit alpha